jgi:hypothetical protein
VLGWLVCGVGVCGVWCVVGVGVCVCVCVCVCLCVCGHSADHLLTCHFEYLCDHLTKFFCRKVKLVTYLLHHHTLFDGTIIFTNDR